MGFLLFNLYLLCFKESLIQSI